MALLTPVINAPKTAEEELGIYYLNALVHGNIHNVSTAFKKGVDPNYIGADGLGALHIVAERKLGYMLDVLMENPKINLNLLGTINMTPLMVAVAVSAREIMQALLRKGADPNFSNINGNMALHYACRNSDMTIVFDLVTSGARVGTCRNVFDVTPLTIAVVDRPSLPITRYLLRHGANKHGNKEFPLLLECALACNPPALKPS
ncbi:hypothetical protein JTB14_017051 [Gonioctena quinquepunctata]|nr:hypothetical protein JTB14_017051 [Gonioctena quinquepunctata]